MMPLLTYQNTLCSALVVIATLAGQMKAAEPFRFKPLDPLGFKEFQETGKYIKQFEIGEDDGQSYGNQGRYDPTPVMMPNWEAKNKNDRGQATLLRADFNTPRKGEEPHLLVFDKRYAVNSSLYSGRARNELRGGAYLIPNRTKIAFHVGNGDVIPILGELYAIKILKSRKTIQLTRVTDSIPEALRPKNKEPSRTIALTSIQPKLFFELLNAKGEESHYYDEVHLLRIDETSCRASIRLIPGLSWWPELNKPRIKPEIKHKPLSGEIGRGDIVAPQGRKRAYKVLNIVPPQTIDGVGRLVGWIELSAEPVVPTEKDKVTALDIIHNVSQGQTVE